MPKEIISKRYQCKYCNTTLTDYDICKKHEENCEQEQKLRDEYITRIKNVFDNELLFYALNLEDMENCIKYNLSGLNADSYDYDDFEYPCTVIIKKYEKTDPYEHYSSDYFNIMLLDEYLDRIREVKNELKIDSQI